MPIEHQPCPKEDESATSTAPSDMRLAASSPLDLLLHVVGPKRADDSQTPIWDGQVNVQRLTTPDGRLIWDYRQLFVTRQPLVNNVLLPGTIVVHGTVQYVNTWIDSTNVSHWRPGTASRDLVVTLLLDCPPQDWVLVGDRIVQTPRCRCVAGEIHLGDFAQQPPVDEWQQHFRAVLTFPKVLAFDSFAVNSSGFALVAQAQLPWQQSPLPPARYQVVLPRPSQPPALVMELDRERLHADYPDAERAFTTAFRNLSGLLRPGGSDPTRCLNWAGFDLDLAGGIPPFMWQIDPKPGGGDAAIDLRLAQGVVRLTLADQRLGDPLVSPRAIATCNGSALIRTSAANTFDLYFHAERPVAVPLVSDDPLPADLDPRLVKNDAMHQLIWAGGRTLLPADLDQLQKLADQAKEPLHSALIELIASCTLKSPFTANLTGTNVPPLSDEPDVNALLAYDDPQNPTKVRWVVPWISPEAQARLTAFKDDTQWDAGFRQALTQLLTLVTAQPRLVYTATPKDTGFAESITWSAVDLVYDALGAAERLRNRTGDAAPDLYAAIPVRKDEPTPDPLFKDVPFLLWGSVPTADGWAELPFFNLTEDLYLRILDSPAADLDPPLISGAATFGTATAELAAATAGASEQKWDVTLLDADVIAAHCGFTFDTKKGNWILATLEARFWEPELSLSGWLWLSNVPPSTEDSVVNFDPWLTALSGLDLRSPRRRELFPCPFLVRFERGSFTRTLTTDLPRTYAYPLAGGWTYQYRDNDRPISAAPDARSVYATLLTNLAQFLPDGKPPAYPPLLWRRHPSLPAIQTLPLTQTRTPPNYPSPSRQFVPFVLPLDPNVKTYQPGTWRFDVSPASGGSGAAAWPTVLDPNQTAGAFDVIAYAEEWRTEPVVGLAFLSVPGLAGYPAAKDVTGTVADAFLPLALAHGLPTNDEIHALAELPRAAQDGESSPPTDALPPDTILTRQAYKARWADLAERVYRAAADGEPALTKDKTGQLAARALIEPYPWNLSSAALEDAKYPGRFELHAVATGSTGLSLTGDAALAGFDGWFRVNAAALERFDPTTLTGAALAAFQRARGTASAIAVVGGSMAAVGDGTSLRDQRGLVRLATTESEIVSSEGTADSPWRVLRTGVSLETTPGTFLDRTLATALSGTTLSLDGFGSWSFWFRDLPLNGKPDKATTYSRADSGDPFFREDVNDPTASGRVYGFRAGYEWRLFDPSKPDGVLRLGFLLCHPLTLEKLTFATDSNTGEPFDTVQSLEIIVRIQLPLPGEPIEQAQSSNAVRLVFDRRAGKGLRLEEAHIAAANATGASVPAELIWPLADKPGAPRLRMVDRGSGDPGIAYQAAAGTTQATLTIAKPTLDLPLLETVWSPRLSDTLTILPGIPIKPIGWTAGPSDAATYVESVQVTIDDTSATKHQLSLTIVHHWGRLPAGGKAEPLGVMLRHTIELLVKPSNLTPPHVYLGDDKKGLELKIIQKPDADAFLSTRSVFVSWVDHEPIPAPDGGTSSTQPQVLPGMPLAEPIPIVSPVPTPPRNAVRGFATLTFGAVTFAGPDGGTPQFETGSGFAEMLFPCEWGASLQRNKKTLGADVVFGSSAGRVDMGYTIRFGFASDVPWSHELLLNGWIEVKNLVSWPILQGAEVQSGDTHFTFPAARPLGTAYSHLRHTARLLLNQVAVLDHTFQAGADNEALLVVADGFALQFLTVVEHRLVEVALAAQTTGQSKLPPPTITGLSNERGWTVVQEVRLATPSVFAAFLDELATYQTPHLGVTSDLLDLPEATLSYQREEIRAALAADLKALAADPKKARGMLLVEASVPVCVNPDDWVAPTKGEPFAPLQYLPLGTLRGILSNLNDFSSGRTPTSQWVYIGLPFLGRLQNPADDGTTTVVLPGVNESRLRLDPILHIYAQALAGGGKQPLDPLPLLLASWVDDAASTLGFQTFDVVPSESWPRLDAATLEESWFRVLSGALVPSAANSAAGSSAAGSVPTAGSVLATLPSDSPGRLSRADALLALVDPNRALYPPSLPPPAAAPPPQATPNFVWGQGALYVLQRVIDVREDPHGFALAGKRLFQIDRPIRKDPSVLRRLPAVTLLPPPLTPSANPPSFPHPVSFAVSPYLGIDYVDEKGSIPSADTPPDALFGELLALDRTGARMIVVATKLFVDTVVTDPQGNETLVHPTGQDLLNWAQETYRQLAADSPFAVVRRRTVLKPKDNTAGLIIDYDFLPFRDTQRALIPKTPPQPLRAELEQLRFAEGQRNRAAPPSRALAVELAPPQTANVQPLRRVDETPWGFSGVRLEMAVAADGVGTVGIDDARLWWQNCQHYVQFAPPLADGVKPPLGGGPMAQQAGRLPKMFRARAIRGLLPAVPDVALPSAQDLKNALVNLGSGDALLALKDAAELQQATLPGTLRCTVIGGRAGVPFAFRPHLIVQALAAGSYNSGAVPVQHRTPRPIPLPPNHLATPSPQTARAYRQDVALDTWGSWFDLGNPSDPAPTSELRTTIASAIPRDDSFFAPGAGPVGLDIAWMDPQGVVAGLPSTATSINLRLTPRGKFTLANWDLTAILVLSAGKFVLDSTKVPLPLPDAAKNALGTLPHGDPVRVEVAVMPKTGFTITGYRQTLTLASRVCRPDGPRLPLQPVYALFEDPDYSRSLATPTAHGAKTRRRDDTNGGTVLVQLATDRREYNPASPIFLACFTDDPKTEPQTIARLVVNRRFGRNVVVPLSLTTTPNPQGPWIEGTVVTSPPIPPDGYPPGVWIQAASLYRLHVESVIESGDTLELQIDLAQTGTPAINLAGDVVVVDVSITDRPVTPPPQAAYGLLRADAAAAAVSCVRFAWSPEAARIDLINPDDLRTEVVRRRAVFRWTDVVRPLTTNWTYAVQKLTAGGSTRAGLAKFEPIAL